MIPTLQQGQIGRTILVGGDPLWNYVVLLLHGEGSNGGTTFVDSSQYARSTTNAANIVTDTGNAYAGSSAIYSDDIDSYLEYASTDFDIIGKNCTFEWYWKTGTLDNIQAFGARYLHSSGAQFSLGYNGTALGWGIDTEVPVYNEVGYASFTSGTYRHVCIEISSAGAATLYFNGASQLTWTFTPSPAGSCIFRLGQGSGGGRTFQQWFDEVRVTIGSPSLRYGGAFTPPSTPLLDF